MPATTCRIWSVTCGSTCSAISCEGQVEHSCSRYMASHEEAAVDAVCCSAFVRETTPAGTEATNKPTTRCRRRIATHESATHTQHRTRKFTAGCMHAHACTPCSATREGIRLHEDKPRTKLNGDNSARSAAYSDTAVQQRAHAAAYPPLPPCAPPAHARAQIHE